MYWNIFCDVVHVQYTNQNIKIATKKTCKITCVRLCFGKGIWAEKNVFVSGPITRMLRPLCPGCKFQVDETEKKKKKRKKSRRNGSQLLRPIVITRPEMVIKCIRFPSGVIRLQFILCYLPLRFVWRHVEEQIKAEVANSRQVQHSCIPIEWQGWWR